MVLQPQHALGDDVEVDLGGAAFDRVALRAEPLAGNALGVLVEALPFPAEAFGAEGFDQEFVAILVHLGGAVFQDGRGVADGLAGFGLFGLALDGEGKGFRIHLVIGDAPAQVAVCDAAGFIRTHMLLGIVLRPEDSGAARAAEAAGRDRGTLELEEAFGDLPAPLTRPTSWSFGTFTSVKKVSQNGLSPEISWIGRASTPGDFMSNRMKLMPSCLVEVSVRTRQKIQSALSA